MNTFRHWFMWSAIEVAPGKYDWRDYDRMMDLAAQNGIKVVIAELVTAAPEWMFHKYPNARYLASDGTVLNSSIGGSSATGGFPGLCLDNPEVRAAAEKFLVALVEHYRNHPALLGYDLWNENSYNGGNPRKMYCYCDATKRKLREWLRGHYGTVEQVARTWNRYSYSSLDDIEPPYNFAGYSDSLDWLQFRIDDAFELFHWRTELFRKHDPNHLVIAHGVAGTLESLPSSAHNEWRSAADVDVWGFTFVASRKGDEPWKQFQAVDLVRGGFSRQAVLARRGRSRAAVDAAAGDSPSARRWTNSRRERRPLVEPCFVCGRRYRHPLPTLAAPSRRSAIRRVRTFRHGWLGHASGRDGRPVRPLGKLASRFMEISSGERRHRARLRS